MYNAPIETTEDKIMLVHQAHEIEWKRSGRETPPKESEYMIKELCKLRGVGYNGFILPWKSRQTKISLHCPIHGEFHNMSIRHFISTDRSCPKCRNRTVKDLDDIMTKVNDEANTRGDCSIVKFEGGYVNNHKRNLIVNCYEHGEYATCYNSFYRLKRGCPICSKRKTKNKARLSDDVAIQTAREYAELKGLCVVDFVGGYKKIDEKNLRIKCTHHGEYLTSLASIKAGRGCAKCAGNARKTESEALSDVTKEAKKYENITVLGFDGGYNGSYSKNLRLLCSNCGVYTTYERNFLSGCSCPGCAEYGYKPKKQGTLYIQRLNKGNSCIGIKFGITNRKTSDRVKQQSQLSKFDHEIFYELTLQDGQKILELENRIKEAMKGKTSYISKEDMPDGYTETVAPSELSTIMYIVKSFEKELTA